MKEEEKETLIIKNFGPIKSVDLELGKITVLIGEQASGKSTIAKVLAICRYFSYIVDGSKTIVEDYQNSFVRNALREWGLDGYEKDDSYLEYVNQDYKLKVASSTNNIEELSSYTKLIPVLEPISKRFKNLLDEYEKLKPKKNNKFGIYPDWQIPHSFLTTDVKNVMNNPFFLPTNRGLQSIFSLGKSSIQNLSDSLFNQFALLDNISKQFKLETIIEPLELVYKNEGGTAYFKGVKDEEYFKLSKGASGYQSVIPIVLVVKYYSEYEKRKRTFIIEEPEISIFPRTQKKLLEFFVANINKNGHAFLIPTHSPYFLSGINDLVLAYSKGQVKKKETQNIVTKDTWLNPNDLSVYELKNGESKDIFDKEIGLINDNIIDDVSDEMNEEFSDLLDIK